MTYATDKKKKKSASMNSFLLFLSFDQNNTHTHTHIYIYITEMATSFIIQPRVVNPTFSFTRLKMDLPGPIDR